MDFKKKSHVHNNNKFLYKRKQDIDLSTNLSDGIQTKRHSRLFLSITFKTFCFAFPCKTSFIQSQNPFKERVSPDLQQKHRSDTTLGTHPSLKKRQREREPSSSSFFAHRLPVSLYSTRSIGLVIFIWRQHSRRCTGISSFVPVIKLEISRFAGQRLCSRALPPNPPNLRSKGARKEGDRWKGTCRKPKGGREWEGYNRFGDIHRYRR